MLILVFFQMFDLFMAIKHELYTSYDSISGFKEFNSNKKTHGVKTTEFLYYTVLTV